MTPQRIQRKRTKGWTAPLDENGLPPINVTRPGVFGNPFVLNPNADLQTRAYVETPAACVGSFLDWLHGRAFLEDHQEQRRELLRRLPELKGRNIMCFCPLFDSAGKPHPCHGDPLLELAAKCEN